MFRLTNKPSEALLKQEEPEFNLPEIESTGIETEPETPSRFFDQLIVTVICLILLLLGMKTGHPRFEWMRERLHTALEASTEATFGVLGRSPLLQGVIRTGQNLIKLEEISQPIWQERKTGLEAMTPKTSATQSPSLPGSVWPANGNVSRSFGWQYNPLSHAREFNSGIEIAAQSNASVYSLNTGEIVEIARQPGKGWQVTINHGAGWISVYRNLGRVQAQIGQKVTPGSVIGVLNQSVTGNSLLWFEVKFENQPVDPMTLFTT